MNKSSARRLFLAAALPIVAGQAAAATSAVRQQDGIIAIVTADAQAATVAWRFARPPPAPVTSIEATVNHRPAGSPAGYEPFPAPGDTLVVEFLIDAGDANRAGATGEAAAAVAASVAHLPRESRSLIGAFDSTYRLIDTDVAGHPDALAAEVAPKEPGGNLTGGLLAGIQAAAALPATRRALIVYTDGFGNGTVPWAQVEEAAKAALVSLNFVIVPSMRLADLANLNRIAAATDGRLLPNAEVVDDYVRTFLTSGARVSFPLDAVRRYIWEPTARLDAGLHYGARILRLREDIEVPSAGPLETASFLWRERPQIVLALAAAILFAGALILVFRQRSSRSAKVLAR